MYWGNKKKSSGVRKGLPEDLGSSPQHPVEIASLPSAYIICNQYNKFIFVGVVKEGYKREKVNSRVESRRRVV